MKRILTGLCAAALVAATTVVGVAPSFAQGTDGYGGGVGFDLRNRGGGFERGFDRAERRAWRRDIRDDRRDFRRDWRREARRDWRRDDYRRGFYGGGGGGWYNGHRGYSYYRPGYREYNGYWFPLAAFAAGAVIGGALNDDVPVRRVYRSNYGSAHVDWCYNRYRSYRAYDNTFQPYNGGRQQCYSPYS